MSIDESTSRAKVLFRVPNEDGTAEVETLWATHLGGSHYKLNNSPFFAYGVSWEDTVAAPFSKEEQFPTFQAVVSKSGNRTIRVIFDEAVVPQNPSDKLLQGLVALRCSYEGAYSKYFSVNIPPDVALDDVRDFLIENKMNWEHADPTYASLYPENA